MLALTGKVSVFGFRAVANLFRRPFETVQIRPELAEVEPRSPPLVIASGFALGGVLTLPPLAQYVVFGNGEMMNKHYGSISLFILFLGTSVYAANLKLETTEAWDAYLAEAKAAMQARLQPGAHFLWIDEEPERRDHVRRKGPLILRTRDHIPQSVPSGLIHDWLGAGFVPNATIADILKVVRDYDHYAHVYKPGVIDSRLLENEGIKDLFFLRFVNKSVVAKTALDCEGEATYIQIDEHRWYGYSIINHIREVARFGTLEQHTLPEGEGLGLIWRLASITRLEEADGGVYAELEALALSRDIPAAFRFFVTPIVRRVSRDSLATSLHQTKVAIDVEKGARKAN